MNRIDKVKEIITRAGEIALSYFGNTTGSRKKDSSIVTQADIRVGEFLTEQFAREIPGSGIINEEGDSSKIKETLEKKNLVWVIDPIDGTAAFHNRLPIWGVAAGLLDCGPGGCYRQPEPVLGIIYLPALGEFYYTDHGIPAIFESPRWGRLEMDISKKDDQFDSETFICVTSNFYKEVDPGEFPGKCRSLGSTSAHFCITARGDSAGGLVKGHLWDLVMGYCILKKAGGIMRTLENREPDLAKVLLDGGVSRLVLISSPGNMVKLQEMIHSI